MSLDEEDRAAPAAAHRTGTPGPRGPTQPRTWGWHSVDTRADLTHSVMRARLPAGLLVGCMAALGAFPPVGRPVYEPLALRIAVVVAALGLVGWVGITTLWRRRVLEAVKRRPALGAVEVGIGMALVGAGGPDGPFSGWTVAPIAVAAVLWPGLSRLAALCTLQLALMWGTGLAASLWGPAALARHVSWDRAGIAPLDALITYGLVLVLAAVLRAGDTLNAEAIRDIGRLSAEIKDLEAPVADRIGERVLMTRLELGVRRPMRRMVGDLGELSDRVEAERDLPPSVAGELRRLLRGARRMQRPAYGSTTLGSLLETEIRAAGIPCEVPEPEEGASLFDPLGTRISADAAEVLAGIVQEALQNMRRHGGGDGHIACRGRWGAAPEDDTVTLAFTNAPQGHHSRYARARAALPGRGHGRTLMTAAVARLGGWVGHRLDPDGSYVCEVHLPRRALADGARMAHGGAGS